MFHRPRYFVLAAILILAVIITSCVSPSGTQIPADNTANPEATVIIQESLAAKLLKSNLSQPW